MNGLYVVFPKRLYQKFNNAESTLLLLMCVSVTNRSRWKVHQDGQASMSRKFFMFGFRELEGESTYI